MGKWWGKGWGEHESDSATFHIDDLDLESLGSIVVGGVFFFFLGCVFEDWVDRVLTWSLVVGSG